MRGATVATVLADVNLLFVYDIFLAFRVSGDKGMLF